MAQGSFLYGTPTRFEQAQRFTPQQQSSLAQLLSMGQQNLTNPLAGFESLKNRANQRFQQETVPALLERFNASGSNALTSPSLRGELSQAGGTLQERLAGLESQYGLGREQLGMQQLGLGLTPQFENIVLGGNEGALPGIFGGLAGGVGEGLKLALPMLLKLLIGV